MPGAMPTLAVGMLSREFAAHRLPSALHRGRLRSSLPHMPTTSVGMAPGRHADLSGRALTYEGGGCGASMTIGCGA